MPPLTITTKYPTQSLARPNGWFEVCNILDLSPPPVLQDEALHAAQNTVTFRVENCIHGGKYAGDVTEFDSYLIKASGVTTWSCSEAFDFADPGYPDENKLELDEGSELLKIIINGDLTLECTRIQIVKPTLCTRIIHPSLSARQCFIEVTGSPLPLARDWIDWFADAGLDVVFRIYGDQARIPAEVAADYSGFFLQLRSCISDTTGGLVISGIKTTATGFRVHFDFWNNLGEREAPLWTTLAQVFATLFPISQVLCGNCRLTAEQWHAALEQGQPHLNSLFIKE